VTGEAGSGGEKNHGAPEDGSGTMGLLCGYDIIRWERKRFFTAAFTISCVSFYFIKFGYDLLATWRSFRSHRE
jgi:hypothetical protein